MDHCYPKSEGLDEQDEDSNGSSEKSNPILVENSVKAVPINQEPIYEKGTVKSGFMVPNSPTVEGESDSNQSDEANENGKAETVPEDASYQTLESRHETESCHPITGSSSTSKFPDHFVTGNLVAPAKDTSFNYKNEALVEIHVMEAEELDMKTHEWHTSCVSNETPGYASHMTSSCSLASHNDSGELLMHKVHDNSSAETLVDITVMSQEEFYMAPAPALNKTPSPPLSTPGQTGLSSFADDTLQGQFPRPTELIPRKSSAKKHSTSWKIIDAINKENIDDSGIEVEPKKERANNNVVIGEKILDEFSLRQLRKMMKEKLQIANNKNSEEDNDTKVGKTRLALQTLN
ncbi:ASPARTIC/GLUTAMIC ACID-RICH PROTEIN [Salix purpurea]|uniref:ASPARTIC/GLUTAMIC ACID-RICH PROTEIN n=1 Tax=Salix purpurea TaxID=77065 RepID=A0A9Q1A9X2_SALPP|nr:ASPARTIC/GLUTAMIC ACID-RICH PROTEIN [Salix purpurea]